MFWQVAPKSPDLAEGSWPLEAISLFLEGLQPFRQVRGLLTRDVEAKAEALEVGLFKGKLKQQNFCFQVPFIACD